MTGRMWAALAFAVLMLGLLMLTPALMPDRVPHPAGHTSSTNTQTPGATP